MKFKDLFFLILSLSFAQFALAQDPFQLKGKVSDGADGQALAGATVQVPSQRKGAFTDDDGKFDIKVKGDTATVVVSYTGYETQTKFINLSAEMPDLEFQLLEKGSEIGTVVIEGNSLEEKLKSTQMSADHLTIMEAKRIPALFGEVDVIKTLQLKPGVQSGGEGTSGIYVRGGGPDQNLFLLDNAPVYNPSHLFGLFSTFNGDAVKDITLYKGGYPAQYGGKLSSVIDIGLREGNKQKFSGSGGLGLISSRLSLEAPIVKEKVSLLVAGRRTYFDVFTRQLNKLNEDKEGFNPIPDYYFYDFNGKLDAKISPRDQMSLSFYGGRDKFKFSSGEFDFKLGWGNMAGAAEWSHAFSAKLLMKNYLTFSDYNYSFDNKFSQFSFKLTSGIRDWGGRSELLWRPTEKHNIRGGLSYIYHTFTVGRFNASSEDGTINFNSGDNYYGNEMGAYVNDEYNLNSKLTINGGLRLSGFSGQNKFYQGLEPRASLNYRASEKVALKAGYARMFQYIHMVSTSGASLPTDIWFPSGKIVTPQRSDQVAASASVLLSRQFLLTNEVYYKWMARQVDFRDGAQIFFNPQLEEEFVFGKGWGYGDEIYLEKKRGPGNNMLDKLTGWVGYTLSWSWRQFDDINSGNKFHPRYDRRHDISVVLIEELNKRLSLSATWVYGTGNAITLPVAWYLSSDPVPGNDIGLVPIYTERNSFRMPAYHRMDFGLVYNFNPKWGESDLTFSIYNVYNRRNPYFIYYDIQTVTDELTGITTFEGYKAKQVSLFPMIPSLTWNFKF